MDLLLVMWMEIGCPKSSGYRLGLLLGIMQNYEKSLNLAKKISRKFFRNPKCRFRAPAPSLLTKK